MNTCTICKSTIDELWSSLQDQIKVTGNLQDILTLGFTERCIFCYRNFLELKEKNDHEWYCKILELLK